MNSSQKGIAVITGASRGIGKAISLRLARDGYALVLNDILDLSQTIEELPSGTLVEHVMGDITRSETIHQITQHVSGLKLPVKALVNNAFAEVRAPFLELTNEDWQKTISVTFLSAVQMSRAILPLMENGGSIVNISSVHSLGASQGFSPYDASKAALNALTRSLAVEFGPKGIRVNAILPGLIITERNQDRWLNNQTEYEAVKMAYPLRRAGRPEEVAELACFLASEGSSFITGTTIPVDGGLLAGLSENLSLLLAKLGD